MNIDHLIEQRLGRLRIWNVVVGLILAVQALTIAVLTNTFSLPVTATFMSGPPGTPPELRDLFDIATGWGVFAFLAISAAALLIIALPPGFSWYKRNLLQNRNYGRWIEYFFSSSIMIVLISQITGITDVAALLAIFGINSCMILFGALQEKYEDPGESGWLPFWFGSFAGIIPWIAIAIYVWAPGLNVSPPGFVYGIMISLFVMFNCFAANMVMQYKQVGPWRDYLFGEKVYIILSLTAKSALAWQVFFPVLLSSS
ncbi:MAG: heliorhodopsin HeR [Actinobacteria bacterium]|nr:heliorhodopsin HeR [Actinomycetota bacterium]MCL5883170.1 heliorhodopsin HeR [Actinomycetota bacterium]